jgi:hypothetical protein
MGSKLVFDGIELPSVRRLSARRMRSRYAVPYFGPKKSRLSEVDEDEDGRRGDEEVGIENDSATRSFYFPFGLHNNRTKAPAGRNVPSNLKTSTYSLAPDSEEESLSAGT